VERDLIRTRTAEGQPGAEARAAHGPPAATTDRRAKGRGRPPTQEGATLAELAHSYDVSKRARFRALWRRLQMPDDAWTVSQLKLQSARDQLLRAGALFVPSPSPAHYAALLQSSGAIVSNPHWRQQLLTHLNGILVDCRSVPDIIQSYCGADPKPNPQKKRWWSRLSRRSPDEAKRRAQFQNAFKPLYLKFTKLMLSRAALTLCMD
jgi:hypothetical protein